MRNIHGALFGMCSEQEGRDRVCIQRRPFPLFSACRQAYPGLQSPENVLPCILFFLSILWSVT